MGLISPGGENLLDFLELRQVLSPYDGDLRDPLWWPQERPVPMRVARGVSGYSPIDDGAQDHVWCRCRNLRIPLQCRHGSCGTSGVSPESSVLVSSGDIGAISSRTVAAVSRFPSRGLRDLWLSLEAFPQGFPTCHRGVSRSLA